MLSDIPAFVRAQTLTYKITNEHVQLHSLLVKYSMSPAHCYLEVTTPPDPTLIVPALRCYLQVTTPHFMPLLPVLPPPPIQARAAPADPPTA